MNHILNSNDELSILLKKNGINDWEKALSHIRNLPYGRNTNRNDLSLVLTENKGTCSSKHAFVKAIADENNIKARLILCLYKMNEINTPGIGSEIAESGLKYVPEAHCYLQIGNEKIDLTTPTSSISRIETDILEETDITPQQVGEFKVKYHKDYMRKWNKENKSEYNFDQIWKIRERCIENLSK